MVHLSDLDWQKPGEQAIADYKKGDVVKVKVLDVDVEKERISLGIKQLTPDNFAATAATHKKGEVVTSTVTAINEGGVEVTLSDGTMGFIRKGELSRERSEQRPDRFAIGDKVDAKITVIDAKTRRVNALDQGARGRGGQEGAGGVRLVGFRRQPGRHPGGGPLQGPEGQGRRRTTTRPRSPRRRARTRPRRSSPPGLFAALWRCPERPDAPASGLFRDSLPMRPWPKTVLSETLILDAGGTLWQAHAREGRRHRCRVLWGISQ